MFKALVVVVAIAVALGFWIFWDSEKVSDKEEP